MFIKSSLSKSRACLLRVWQYFDIEKVLLFRFSLRWTSSNNLGLLNVFRYLLYLEKNKNNPNFPEKLKFQTLIFIFQNPSTGFQNV